MAFTVNHGVDQTLAGQLATEAGLGRFNQERDKFLLQKEAQDRDFSLRQQQVAEQQRQFDIQTAMQAEQQADQNRRYQQQMAMQAYGQQAQFANQQAGREYDLLSQQMGIAGQRQLLADRFGMEQDGLMGAQIQELDGQLNAAMGQARQMKLSPAGQVVFNKLAGEWAQIAQQNLRPDQMLSLKQQFAGALQGANLEQYEEKIPTTEENFRKSLTRTDGLPVNPIGQPLTPGWYMQEGVRNGVPTYNKVWVKDPNHTDEQDFNMRLRKLPTGGYAYESEDGKITEFKPLAGSAGPTEWERDQANIEMDLKRQEFEEDQSRKDMELAIKFATSPSPDNPNAKPPDFNKASEFAAKIGEARHKALGRQGAPGEAQTMYGRSAQGMQNPNEGKPLPTQPGQPQGDQGQQPQSQAAPQPSGSGAQNDPIVLSGMSDVDAKAFIASAPIGAFFVDDQGNLFQKTK